MSNSNVRQPGLPSFLDLVTDGKVPNLLVGSIQGVVDLEEFIALAKRERLQQTGVAASTNGAVAFSSLVVPANEAWYLYGFSVTSASAAAQGFSLQPVARLNIGGSQAPIPTGDVVSITNTTLANVVVAGGFPRIWLPPGSDLGAYVVNLTSGAPALSLSAYADIVRARV